MLNAIKTELYKSIHNKYFVFAMILAFIIQLFNFTANYDYYEYAMEMTPLRVPSHEDTFSIMVFWLGQDGYTMGYTLACYMFPIIAVLPFGWSFINEIRNGYQNNMLCRMSKFQYFISKYIAAFISGGIVPAFMLVSNLFMNSFIGLFRVPYSYTLTSAALMGTFASKLHYTHPVIFILIWTGIAFLWGGAYAGLTLLLGQILKKSILAMIVPFLLALLADSLCGLIVKNYDWSFISNYFPATAVLYNNWIIFVQIFALIAVGFIGGLVIYQGKEVL